MVERSFAKDIVYSSYKIGGGRYGEVWKGTYRGDEVRYFLSYMWRIVGQWDILLLNLTFIGFTNFFRCLIFDLSFLTKADVVTIKDETLKKICEAYVGPFDFHWFQKSF